MKDPYLVLGVSRQASPEAIKTAYRTLSREWHPDITIHDKAMAHERMCEINTAWHALKHVRELQPAGFSYQRATQYHPASSFATWATSDAMSDLLKHIIEAKLRDSATKRQREWERQQAEAATQPTGYATFDARAKQQQTDPDEIVWTTSANGNPTTLYHGHRCTVFKRTNGGRVGWWTFVADGRFSRESYQNKEATMGFAEIHLRDKYEGWAERPRPPAPGQDQAG